MTLYYTFDLCYYVQPHVLMVRYTLGSSKLIWLTPINPRQSKPTLYAVATFLLFVVSNINATIADTTARTLPIKESSFGTFIFPILLTPFQS